MARKSKRKSDTTINCERQPNGQVRCCVYPKGSGKQDALRCWWPKKKK